MREIIARAKRPTMTGMLQLEIHILKGLIGLLDIKNGKKRQGLGSKKSKKKAASIHVLLIRNNNGRS